MLHNVSQWRWLVAMASLAAAPFVAAHHSTAMYDSENPIELAGTVVEWQFKNPHVIIRLDVADEDGESTVWALEGVDIDRNRIDAATYLNLRFGYDLEAGGSRVRLFANVENLLDRDPPIAPVLMSGWTGAAHTNGNFDQLGRRYTVGARFSF